MPVEITLPLTKLEQAVADARAAEQVMAAKVEEAKLALKSAKAAWEEAVGGLMLAVDEMIADKRQPSIPFDADDGAEAGAGDPQPDPTPPAPAGAPVDAEYTVTTAAVEIVTPPPAVTAAPYPGLMIAPKTDARWRSLPVTELEAPQEVFTALDTFGVNTLGQLANALQDGHTFNLKLVDVYELREAIEDVSQEDDEPIKFDKDAPVAVTVKDEEEKPKYRDPADEWEEILDKREQENADEEAARTAVKTDAEAKPAKKRGRPKKAKANVTATPPTAPPEPPSTTLDYMDL